MGAPSRPSLDTTTSVLAVSQHQMTGPAYAAPGAMVTYPLAVPVARTRAPFAMPALVRMSTGSDALPMLPPKGARPVSVRQ